MHRSSRASSASKQICYAQGVTSKEKFEQAKKKNPDALVVCVNPETNLVEETYYPSLFSPRANLSKHVGEQGGSALFQQISKTSGFKVVPIALKKPSSQSSTAETPSGRITPAGDDPAATPSYYRSEANSPVPTVLNVDSQVDERGSFHGREGALSGGEQLDATEVVSGQVVGSAGLGIPTLVDPITRTDGNNLADSLLALSDGGGGNDGATGNLSEREALLAKNGNEDDSSKKIVAAANYGSSVTVPKSEAAKVNAANNDKKKGTSCPKTCTML